MRLRSLRLTDIGPFASKTVDLYGSMIGVTGPNGAGKSTVLRSVAFAVTGDYPRFGRKEAVRIGAAGPHQPSVVLDFETAAGDAATVARWLPSGQHRGRHRLVVGDESIGTDDQIATWFEAELGAPVGSAQDVLFVPQGGLTDVITAPPARRTEMLNRVFGLEAAARGYKAAVEHVKGLPGTHDPSAECAARDNLAGLEAQLATASAELLAAPVPDRGLVDTARAVVARAQRRAALLVARDRYSRTLADATDRLSRAAVVAPSTVDLGRALDRVRDARAHQAAVVAFARLTRDLAAATAARSVAAAECSSNQDPGPEPVPGPELLELRGRRELMVAVTRCSVVGSVCPVCRGPFAPDADVRAAAESGLERLRTAEGEHSSAVSVWRAARDAHVRAVQRRDARDRDLLAATALLNEVPEPDPSGVDVGAAERGLSDVTAAAARASSDASERAVAAAAADRATADLSAVDAELDGSEADGVVAHALALVREADAQDDRVRALTARVEVLETTVHAARGLYARIQSARFAADAVGAHRAVIEEVIETLHRDAAPAAAAGAAMAGLQDNINLRLGQTAAAFRVTIGADGDVTAVFSDGSPPRRAGLLSPGQQTVLALAWRVAIVDRYSPRAGVLCLDEPTTGLDETRISALRHAFDAWRTSDDNLQFVVVTHDRRLRGAFDQTVEL